MAENTASKQRGRPFERGKSGNPAGRPKGSRNRTTLAAEALLEGSATAVVKKAVELALAGDVPLLRALLDRICPVRRDKPVTVPGLPAIESLEDLPKLTAAILASVTRGDITLAEANALTGLVEAHARISALVGDEEPGGVVVESPEALAARMNALRIARMAAIQREREEFLPQRQAEVRELKAGMKDGYVSVSCEAK